MLFRGSVGRWDFERGNQQQLIRSITTKLWPMGDDTAFVPGHGPMSTFGHERATNPFVSDAVLDQAGALLGELTGDDESDELDDASIDAALAEFRSFLDTVDPHDFGRDAGS